MNKLIILLLLFAATHSFGQKTKEKPPVNLMESTKLQSRDTTLRVIIVDKDKTKQQPVFFINGKCLMNQNFLTTLSPNQIENIEVIKRDTLIENISYAGQVFITTKKDYAPKFISLTELKTKYTNFKGMQVVFTLDGNFITSNYDHYLIDENHLLAIIVDKLETDKEKIEIGLIKLLTNTEENIINRSQVILRATEVSLNK